MEASELKKDGQVQKVIVTGCLAQRYSTELAGEGLSTPAALELMRKCWMLFSKRHCQWHYRTSDSNHRQALQAWSESGAPASECAS